MDDSLTDALDAMVAAIDLGAEEVEADDYVSEEKGDTEFLEFKSEIFAEEDDENYGTFEGYGSVFNNTDLGNDVIRPGAFASSLKSRGVKGVKLLYQHKTDMPIGVFDEIIEDGKGLRVKGRLALKTAAGRDAYELLKMGALDGLSIGFRTQPKGYDYDKRTRRRSIKDVDLMEISLVTFPMNPRATVHSVKGQDISIRELEKGMRDAFALSRSEAKMAARAVHESFQQRDAETEDDGEALEALSSLTETLKTF
tara:strand:- start:302 stop:1063 length:762 start_codon:yes stop_codon:yes gene_type:complete